jgi:serine protease AprX
MRVRSKLKTWPILALLTMSAGLVPLPAVTAVDRVSVIVTGDDLSGAAAGIARLGGTVTGELAIIDGLVADVPPDRLDRVAALAGVESVTPNGRITLAAGSWSPDAVPPIAALTTEVLDLDSLWRRGITGDGVGVALIDSGVTPVGGLDGTGTVVHGPDLSFDAPFDGVRHLDVYGHGTHLAGIIAGNDPGVGSRPSQRDARSAFVGVAPGARIVSVKVADGMGAADVSQVIAGIQWVVEHKDDPEAGIGVLVLAFGTDGTQDYRLDPLAHAVEQAWHAGIVVVVAAGNDGVGEALRNPATDPVVIAVGATDPAGTARVRDDRVLAFSNCGTDGRAVDLVAPGRSVSSLRVPGSYIDTMYPAAADGERFFRGTGTSQATAVVAGVAALVLDARPDLSPDEVKALLTTTADRVRGTTGACAGVGTVDAKGAVSSRVPRRSSQTWETSDGSGSLEGARGTHHVYRDGEPVVGEIDVTGGTWSGGTWSGGTWSGGTWSGGTWSGGTWSGGTWSGGTWSGGTWSGGTWSGGTWSGGTWSGGTWSVSSWD